jgi:hypothetical protein
MVTRRFSISPSTYGLLKMGSSPECGIGIGIGIGAGAAQ